MRSSVTNEPAAAADLADLVRSQAEAAARENAKRHSRLLVSLSRFVADFLIINLAFIVAWWVRYESSLPPMVADSNYVGVDVYYPIQIGLAAIILVIFTFSGVYRHRPGVSWLDEVGTIANGTTQAIALTIIAVFYYRPDPLSRLMFVYALVLIIIFLSVFRVIERIIRARLRKRGVGLDRVLVVGAGSLGKLMLQNIMARPDLGFDVVGFVDDERTEDIGRFKALGRPSDMPQLIREHGLDQVIIALPAARHREIVRILGNCRDRGVSFRIVPDFYEFSLRQVDISDVSGIPLIGLKDTAMSRWALAVKRVIDVWFSLFCIILFSWLLGIIALAVKLDSPGPVIFRQQRLGRGGRPFTTYKFRSMREGSEAELAALKDMNEADGPIFKIREDPRITRVGRWLRRASLDELPQLFNVLNGDMSLVGPRPPIPAEVEQYEDWHLRRLECAPGLTGLWQVSGRSNIAFDEMVLLDLWYVENWSLALDIKILAQTLPAILSGRGAY